MTDATALYPSARLIDWARPCAGLRLGHASFRYAGSDGAFTYLGAMLLVIAASSIIDHFAPRYTFELSLLVLLAYEAPVVTRRMRALGLPLGLLGLGTAFALGTVAVVLRNGGLPDLPVHWQVAAVTFSRETQAGLLVLALAPARRQVGVGRQVRVLLLLALSAVSVGAASAGIAGPA